ncbi:MAG: hypothetical protein H7X95_06580 [Deltaproteobacteria bacterium]|nr:hypothetical protein [Deltaproteobacteria bacterium]
MCAAALVALALGAGFVMGVDVPGLAKKVAKDVAKNVAKDVATMPVRMVPSAREIATAGTASYQAVVSPIAPVAPSPSIVQVEPEPRKKRKRVRVRDDAESEAFDAFDAFDKQERRTMRPVNNERSVKKTVETSLGSDDVLQPSMDLSDDNAVPDRLPDPTPSSSSSLASKVARRPATRPIDTTDPFQP